ncbi:K(+) efflux antiporter 2, chloroplastic [Primulina huaijiensis]|uniref:K(+) efflux antiporter 2, chloroplastic n=1 Tax=Primulina huaijiensis TaxID=1492673 RepID=UPI003CC71027
MDIAYLIPQPNVAHRGDVASCRVHENLNMFTSLNYIGFSCQLFGDMRLVPKDYSRKKLKKNILCCSSTGCTRVLGNLRLWCNDANGYPFYNHDNIFKMSKHVTLPHCQVNDSTAYVNDNTRDFELIESVNNGASLVTDDSKERSGKEETESLGLDELRELLQKALKDLEVARSNSIMFEEKAQSISEAAIALKDEAVKAWDEVNISLGNFQEIVNEESIAKEGVQKAMTGLSLTEAKFQVLIVSPEIVKENNGSPKALRESASGDENGVEQSSSSMEDEEALLAAKDEIKECRSHLENCEAQLRRLQNRKEELQKELDKLNDVAEQAQIKVSKAEEDVANIMLLAEQAVACELKAAQNVDDAEIALQRAEKKLAFSNSDVVDSTVEDGGAEEISQEKAEDGILEEREALAEVAEILEHLPRGQLEELILSDASDKENKKTSLDIPKDPEADKEKLKTIQSKIQEMQKEATREGSTLTSPKALIKKSSRFFSASFFSSIEGDEFTPASVFHGLVESARKQLPKLVFGSLLVGAGIAFYIQRGGRVAQLFQQPDIISTSIDEVSATAKPLVPHIKQLPQRIKKLVEMLPHQEINEEEASLFDMLWLLLASVIFVPLFLKIPGGSPVLGYLAAGILIGPYGLSIIRNVHETKAIAEFGVVFLLFNIGLELSVERLSSMKKYVFGLGSAQVLVTAVVTGLIAHFIAGQPSPAAIVIGNGLALSSTAVVLQVLQERGESTSRHGRATFSVLLFQDLAVVVLLILIPLLSPSSSKGGVGFQAIAEALGLAAIKAVVAISAIIAGGRLLLRPIYKQIAENQNPEIFSANTLLVILGTSLLTARAGLSMALGAFLAGLLLAETEFSLQVESDIAPYRGLLLGLFFMTVGMSIDPKLLVSNFPVVIGALGLLIVGKTILVALVGRFFGISVVSAIRVGLLLAPGGEFAFVAFGEAVNQGIMSTQMSSLLFLVVGISMALTPWLAAGGQLIASRFELHDVRSLLPVESETDDLRDHIIICGFGRVGQIIAQLLSERLIPFVALDVRSDRVAVGRALDLPVYFGDAGSREVLHKIGAQRACAAAVTLDSPGANYRTVWALSKYFPNVKTFVRAHDVDHGLNLEKAGATAVVPETLEPSLQLAAAVLAQAKLQTSEIAAAINEFRSRHLSELTELCEASGSSLGYGFTRISKPKPQPSDSSDENRFNDGALAT